MNKKTLSLSLATAVLALPLLVSTAFSYPGNGHNSSRGNSGCPYMESNSQDSMPMRDSQFMQDIQPVRDANRALYSAMQTGDIKAIQAQAKKVSQAITSLKNADVKAQLSNANKILLLMSTSTSYQEMRLGYRAVMQEVRGMHRQGRMMAPKLLVDTNTYQTLQDAELVLEQLNSGFRSLSLSTINSRTDALIGLLKSIKSAPLQGYIDSALVHLNGMKKAKTLLGKMEFKKPVYFTVQTIMIITEEKTS